MTDKQLKLAAGSLLHDFGKLLSRCSDGRDSGADGYEYLKERSLLKDHGEILDCIRYHYGSSLKKAGVSDDAVCYVTYIADMIAAASDGISDLSKHSRAVREIPSGSVFNILNGNDAACVYAPALLSGDGKINHPERSVYSFSEKFYEDIVSDITASLEKMTLSDEYIDSLLTLLESRLAYIPSSAEKSGKRDISLYDHVKLTAAFSLCIEQYLTEQEKTGYKQELSESTEEFFSKKAFCIYSMDISGIQNFIYNVSSKGALKGMRSRSFYLEVFLENAVDELLVRLGLCRANVIYTGGGHTYMLVPGTQRAVEIIADFESGLNSWLRDTFSVDLYAAGGYSFCSANDLKNIPDGSYRSIFSDVSRMISEKKLHRYTSSDIAMLNRGSVSDHSRECSICHRSDKLTEEDECTICRGLKNLSSAIIGYSSFFVVLKREYDEGSVPLPFGCSLHACPENKISELISSPDYVRAYSKNKGYTGLDKVSDIWVGDYSAERSFEDLVSASDGISRLGVIRADVDHMGQAFVNGFVKTGGGKYETLSRTSALSGKLSLFFKLHINSILKNGEFQLFRNKNDKKRNAVIIYSGGDDLFIAGGWDDIICFAVDLYREFRKFTQGTLTFSAGIGIFDSKFPVSAMAYQTGRLESMSKQYNNKGIVKNAVTLFDKTGTYSWDEFIDDVLGQKLSALQDYFDDSRFHGKGLLYRMLELIRDKSSGDRLNIARFAYLLSNLKPEQDRPEAEHEKYNVFSRKIYRWIQDENECRKLVTAIYIYAYMCRESEGYSYEETR